MPSPRAQVEAGLSHFWRDHAREELATWRGDPDASPAEERARRHRRLQGPAMRDAFLELAERGAVPPRQLDALAGWLHEAALMPARLAAREERRKWLARSVPHDSDWHALGSLLGRIEREPRARERHQLARSVLEPLADGNLIWARREERREALAERVAWLPPSPSASDDSTKSATVLADTELSDTDDVWQELLERLAHAARAPLETWADLLFVLRAPRLDDAVAARRRWPRVAEQLGPMRAPLHRFARAERGMHGGHGLLVVEPRVDVRVHGGRERGVLSEREACLAMGRAYAAVTTHPATPEVLARPREGFVGWQLGAVLAHRLASSSFARRALGLDTRAARAVAETALALEVAETRLHAVHAQLWPHRQSRDFAARARDALVTAHGVDVPEPLAALTVRTHRPLRGRAIAMAPRLFVALRHRFDEDWWLNPRLEGHLRAGTARGDAAAAEALYDGLEAPPTSPAARYAELL